MRSNRADLFHDPKSFGASNPNGAWELRLSVSLGSTFNLDTAAPTPNTGLSGSLNGLVGKFRLPRVFRISCARIPLRALIVVGAIDL